MPAPKASVPKHVKERAAEADKKLEEMGKGKPGGTPPEPAAPAAPTPAPAPTLEPQPAVPAATATEPAVPAISIAPPEPAPAAPDTDKVPGPKPGEAPEETIRRMSAALLILQGKYNAEVPRLMKENRQLQEENDRFKGLGEENDRLKASATQLEQRLAEAEAKATAAIPVSADVTDFDKNFSESLGIKAEELAVYRQSIEKGMIASLTKQGLLKPASAAEPAPAAKPSASAPQPPAKPSTTIAPEKAAYLETLDALIGGKERRIANFKDPAFLQFLNTDPALGPVFKDKTTGRSIAEITYEAENNNDALTMAEIYRVFDQWKNGTTVPAASDKPASHLMPPQKGGSAELNTNKKPFYSQAQLDAFQKRVRNHEFSGIGKTAEEAKKLADEYKLWSDEFAAARAEGRIKG